MLHLVAAGAGGMWHIHVPRGTHTLLFGKLDKSMVTGQYVCFVSVALLSPFAPCPSIVLRDQCYGLISRAMKFQDVLCDDDHIVECLELHAKLLVDTSVVKRT